jgi:hypothetical protein
LPHLFLSSLRNLRRGRPQDHAASSCSSCAISSILVARKLRLCDLVLEKGLPRFRHPPRCKSNRLLRISALLRIRQAWARLADCFSWRSIASSYADFICVM